MGARWSRGGKRSAAPGESGPSLWLPEPLSAEGIGAPHPGRGRTNLWLPGPLASEGKTRAAPGERPPEPLATWAALRGGKRHAAPGERPPKLLAAWSEHGECSPYTATSACSAPPSPQHDYTELANLNKRSPPRACVRAEIRHRRDGKQKPNKQRESLQKGPVQQIKIPERNTDYTGRGL